MPFNSKRWCALCDQLGIAAHSRFEQLQDAYSEPQRAYHTAQHIEECLFLFDTISSQLNRPALVEYCIWTHDLVYEPKRSDNELRSAEFAVEWLGNEPHNLAPFVKSYILATKHHQASPEDMDLQALLDIDLAILASRPARFKEYGKQVRFEYSFVPWLIYVFKRKQFLKTIAKRPQLFHHPVLAEQLESIARKNLA